MDDDHNVNPYESPVGCDSQPTRSQKKPRVKKPGVWCGVLLMWTMVFMGYLPTVVVRPGGWDDPLTLVIPKIVTTGLSVFVIWAALLNAQRFWWFGILPFSAWLLWIQSFFIVLGVKL